jgi:mono/diheme cytochrome c family protein
MQRSTIYITTIGLLLGISLWGTSCADTAFSQGQASYKSQCANCHMDDGSGLQGLIPPLAGADYLIEHKNELACIIRKGMEQPIMVNGKVYNQQIMPANTKLTEAEITNICNYILSAWGNKGGELSLPEVKTQLQKCQ